MRKISRLLLILTGFVIVLPACAPLDLPSTAATAATAATPATAATAATAAQPATAATPATAAQPAVLPLTGANPSLLGAAALTIQENRPSTGALTIVPVAADTGQPVGDAEPKRLRGYADFVFSSDRSQMGFISTRSTDCAGFCLHLLDLQTWKETVRPLDIKSRSDVWFPVTFFDENQPLPVVFNQKQSKSQIRLVPMTQDGAVQEYSLPANVIRAAYTPQGNLAIYANQNSASGQESFVYLALLDGADLHLLWEKTLPEVEFIAEWPDDQSDPTKGKYLNPAATFSPDGSKLYLAAADKPELVTVDFSKQTVSTARIQPRLSLLERLIASTAGVAHAKTLNGISKSGVLSPDGRYFYVVGQETKAVKNEQGEYELEVSPLGLQVIDTQDGALLRSIATKASQLAVSMDGKTLLLQSWREQNGDPYPAWTDVLDTTSWEVIQTLQGTANPSRLLDGSPAWLVTKLHDGKTSSIALYRPGETAPISQTTSSHYIDWILIP